MSFVTTQPGALAASTMNLRDVDSAMRAGDLVAASLAAGVARGATDESLVRMARQFTAQIEMCRMIRAQAPAILRQLAEVLSGGSGSCAATQATNPHGAR